MEAIFIHYPKCSTCQKAFKFAKERGMSLVTRDIVEDTPSKDEIRSIIDKSGFEFKKFFNTSGLAYRELGLKNKVNNMTIEEATELLASNGMLIKRPILITDKDVLVGFKQDEYDKINENT